MANEKSFEDRLKELELKKLEKEIEKLTEADKKTKWYKSTTFWTILWTGLVAATVILFFVDKVFIPIIKQNLEIEVVELKKKLNIRETEFDEKLRTLKLEKEKQYADLVTQYEDIKSEYKFLSELKEKYKNISDIRQSQINALQKKLQHKEDELNSKIEQLKQEQNRKIGIEPFGNFENRLFDRYIGDDGILNVLYQDLIKKYTFTSKDELVYNIIIGDNNNEITLRIRNIINEAFKKSQKYYKDNANLNIPDSPKFRSTIRLAKRIEKSKMNHFCVIQDLEIIYKKPYIRILSGNVELIKYNKNGDKIEEVRINNTDIDIYDKLTINE